MQRLSTLSFTPISGTPALQFAWKPETYNPANGTPWVRADYLPQGDIPISTNPIQTRAQRLLQVSCFVDERQGEDEAYRLADAVSNHFFPADGTTETITSGGLNIHINRRPTKSPLQSERAGFVGVAVLIDCIALI